MFYLQVLGVGLGSVSLVTWPQGLQAPLVPLVVDCGRVAMVTSESGLQVRCDLPAHVSTQPKLITDDEF